MVSGGRGGGGGGSHLLAQYGSSGMWTRPEESLFTVSVLWPAGSLYRAGRAPGTGVCSKAR